ncbi:DUF5623 domain-containing protein [Rhizobium mesosinicum]|uniref:DUF5623 domain-containing protein n=1 Tax=Rhizobium mesosinicum TaxID=335017 RepID=A0ABS7GVY1_9HYPH|nr:DUF5623 domain-containing protein [Rhizobium mesosinicum]MBW9053488.1 DUF5623 domain-containing protein [Rhizobium mesosinicum]
MSVDDIRPTTIGGIKRLAKTISKQDDVPHSVGLDRASARAGFSNYTNALRTLQASTIVPSSPGFSTFISVHWRNPKTKSRGNEIIEVSLPEPIDEIIAARQYKYASGLRCFTRWASDLINCHTSTEGANSAIALACKAARTLQFMASTGLRPSSKSMPIRGDFGRNLPGRDHGSSWYDPIEKRYLFADEPYAAAVKDRQQERSAWSLRNRWEIAKPLWAGMYYPEGGSELYLISDGQKGLPLGPVLLALSRMPAPVVPENCKRVTMTDGELFRSPGELRDAEERAQKAKQKRGPQTTGNTVPYRMVMASGRRPKAKMAIATHQRVGQLLKDVISATRQRAGIVNRLASVRSELDDWVQLEYDRNALPDGVFFELYYHERNIVPDDEYGIAGRSLHIERLQEAMALIASSYPDCRPVRGLLRKLDLALQSLTSWK